MAVTATFDQFYAEHYPKLTGSLRLVCGDSGVAEELAQEAFVRAYSKWATVSTMESPGGWLYRVAFNLARRRWRLHANRKQVEFNEFHAGAHDAITTDRMELTAAIGKLPLKQRAAVVTRYVLGYSTEEAAELVGMSEANLRVTLHRATTALRLDPSIARSA